MARYVLYGTLGCHLCELAAELLKPLVSGHEIAMDEVDISGSDELVIRYGVRIPVLRSVQDGAELGWPFDGATARAWLAEH